MAFDLGAEEERRLNGCSSSSHVNNGMRTVECSMFVKYGHVPNNVLMGSKAVKPESESPDNEFARTN